MQQISCQFYFTRKLFSSSIALSTSFSGTWKKQRFIGCLYLLYNQTFSVNVDLRAWPFPLQPIRPVFISSFCSMTWREVLLSPPPLHTHRNGGEQNWTELQRTEQNCRVAHSMEKGAVQLEFCLLPKNTTQWLQPGCQVLTQMVKLKSILVH